MVEFILALMYWFVKLIENLFEHKRWGCLTVILILFAVLYIAAKA